ncbi:MAG: glycosyl hydrolase family 28-related protein [Salinivirgaceae bacterium]|jgi:hypothetical protein|nr:glycosyl hydrolase family 28-related protein [Salinivirgaceae bacterium]
MKGKNAISYMALIAILLATFTNLYGQVEGLVNVKRVEQIITVGGSTADVPGFSSEAIQIALDAIKTRGGGTVKLNPGTYNIIGSVRLSSHTKLTGAGKSTILKKCDGFKTSFIVDADWGMLKAVVKDASGFKRGMGIELYDDKNRHGYDVSTAVITDIQDNVIYFDNRNIHDYYAGLNGTISNACSIIEAVEVEEVTISNLVIEGNKANNDSLNGCRGGGVFIQKSRNCLVEKCSGKRLQWRFI